MQTSTTTSIVLCSAYANIFRNMKAIRQFDIVRLCANIFHNMKAIRQFDVVRLCANIFRNMHRQDSVCPKNIAPGT